MPILDDLLSVGMYVIHPLEPGSMNLKVLKKHYGERIAFNGNINMDLLTTGSTAQVRSEVRESIALLGPGCGYLASSSNSVSVYCRADNVKAMVEAVKEFG